MSNNLDEEKEEKGQRKGCIRPLCPSFDAIVSESDSEAVAYDSEMLAKRWRIFLYTWGPVVSPYDVPLVFDGSKQTALGPCLVSFLTTVHGRSSYSHVISL